MISISDFGLNCVNCATSIVLASNNNVTKHAKSEKCKSKCDKQSYIVWNDEHYRPLEQCKRNHYWLIVHVALELNPKRNLPISTLQMKTFAQSANLLIDHIALELIRKGNLPISTLQMKTFAPSANLLTVHVALELIPKGNLPNNTLQMKTFAPSDNLLIVHVALELIPKGNLPNNTL